VRALDARADSSSDIFSVARAGQRPLGLTASVWSCGSDADPWARWCMAVTIDDHDAFISFLVVELQRRGAQDVVQLVSCVNEIETFFDAVETPSICRDARRCGRCVGLACRLYCRCPPAP